MAVDGRMPQVVDGSGRAGLHLGGPWERSVNDLLQVVGIRQRALHAEAQRVGGHVLPERGVTLVGGDLVVQIRTQIVLPAIHGVVGQRPIGHSLVRRLGMVLIAAAHRSPLFRCTIILDLLAVHVVGLKREVLLKHPSGSVGMVLILLGEGVLPIRHQDVIGTAACQMVAALIQLPAHPARLRCPGAHGVGSPEVVVDGICCPHQGRSTFRRPRIEPVEKVRTIGFTCIQCGGGGILVHEAPYPTLDNNGFLTIDDSFLTLVDAPIANADIRPQRRGKGVAHGGNGHMHPRAVILEPVGKVLVFLRLRAFADVGVFLGNQAVGACEGPIEILVVLDGDTRVVAGTVFRPVCVRLEFRILRQVVGSRHHRPGDAIPRAGLLFSEVADECIPLLRRHTHRTLPHRPLPRDVELEVLEFRGGVIDVVDDGLGVGIAHANAILVHPGFVTHVRIVVQRVHLRRTPADRQNVGVVRGQHPLVFVGRIVVRLVRMKGEQVIFQVGIGQVVEGHRTRVVQGEHQIRFDNRHILADERLLGNLGLHRWQQAERHQQQRRAHGTRNPARHGSCRHSIQAGANHGFHQFHVSIGSCPSNRASLHGPAATMFRRVPHPQTWGKRIR